MSTREARLARRNEKKLLAEIEYEKDCEIWSLKYTIDYNNRRYGEADALKEHYYTLIQADLRVREVRKKAEEQKAARHARYIETMEKAVKEVYKPFLLRCHLLEKIAIHQSLDHPDVRGYRLPPITMAMDREMTKFVYELRESGDPSLKALEDRVYHDDYMFETRTGSLDAWIDGEIVPHPAALPHSPHLVSHRERSRSPPRRGSNPTPFKGYNDASSSTDSGSQGFEIVPATRRFTPVFKCEEFASASD